MISAILATKKEMSAKFLPNGKRTPVTVVAAQPNIVLYSDNKKIKLGFLPKKKVKKTENAFVKIAGFSPRFVKEFKIKENSAGSQKSSLEAGAKVNVSVFAPGDIVKVTGQTKGKGFAGGVKRWGFAGGPKTHGQSDRHRAPGSIGQSATPGRVFKGKKMAGHMGNRKKTTTGLQIVEVDEAKNLLFIQGAVPGANNGFLVIQKTGRVKNFEEKQKEDIQKEDQSQLAKEDKDDSEKGQDTEKKAEGKEPKSENVKEDQNNTKGEQNAAEKN